ncbi:MAG: hypothetical protein SVS15_09600, partial [Thermodesulfobacteriota bacterium]|nr:hypothetical protein [Thermodesulfobacteriota bacterium]
SVVVIAIIVGIPTVFAAYNFYTERNALRKQREKLTNDINILSESLIKKVDDKLRKIPDPAKIELFDSENRKLDGNTVDASIEPINNEDAIRNKYSKIKFFVLFKNIGNSTNEYPLRLRVYSKGDINFLRGGYGEPECITSSKMRNYGDYLGILYPEMDLDENIDFIITNESLKKGKHPLMLKTFYGASKPIRTNLFVNIKENYKWEDPGKAGDATSTKE